MPFFAVRQVPFLFLHSITFCETMICQARDTHARKLKTKTQRCFTVTNRALSSTRTTPPTRRAQSLHPSAAPAPPAGPARQPTRAQRRKQLMEATRRHRRLQLQCFWRRRMSRELVVMCSAALHRSRMLPTAANLWRERW